MKTANVPAIEGANAIVDWFGCWPRFHDHYLVQAPSTASAAGVMTIEAWVTMSATDAQGYFLRERHCLVTFELSGIDSVELTEPIFPAVIFELTLTDETPGWTIAWSSSYGAGGCIQARVARVSVEPRIPDATE